MQPHLVEAYIRLKSIFTQISLFNHFFPKTFQIFHRHLSNQTMSNHSHSQPTKPYVLTPHPNDGNLTQSQPDPENTPTRAKPCLSNPRRFTEQNENSRRPTKRVSIQPMPMFSPVGSENPANTDPWPNTILSELNVTSESYAESLITRVNQLNDDDLQVVDAYERNLRKVSEKNAFLENQVKHKDRVIEAKNEIMDDLRGKVNQGVIGKRKLEYRIRKLESDLAAKNREIKYVSDGAHERDVLYQGVRVDLLKNKHRMNKLCNAEA